MTERTRRQEILDLLASGDQSFEGLRHLLRQRISPRDLEDELRHVERSARREGARLVITPAECEACHHVFRDARHYRTPGRCPKCRSERIADALFRLEPA